MANRLKIGRSNYGKAQRETILKRRAKILTVTPVFPGKEEHTSQALSSCLCTCYCDPRLGEDQTSTDLRTYDRIRG